MECPIYDASFSELERMVNELRKQDNRLLELCMFALIRDTKIYNGELDDVTKLKLMKTIKDNLNSDTYTLRLKLIDVYEKQEEIVQQEQLF